MLLPRHSLLFSAVVCPSAETPAMVAPILTHESRLRRLFLLEKPSIERSISPTFYDQVFRQYPLVKKHKL
jgi:hypothetical protein